MADVGKLYNEFFGDGLWEKQYKRHIVVFAEKCIKDAIDKANKAILCHCGNKSLVHFCQSCLKTHDQHCKIPF